MFEHTINRFPEISFTPQNNSCLDTSFLSDTLTRFVRSVVAMEFYSFIGVYMKIKFYEIKTFPLQYFRFRTRSREQPL